MTTWLLIVYLNGKIFLTVPNVHSEIGCIKLMEQVELDLPKRMNWNYSLKCYKIE